MTEARGLVPSDELPTGLEALRHIAHGATRVQAAVAFVTAGGVELFEGLRANNPAVTVELVARGAPITDPRALSRLADMGIKVSVVIGNRASLFHPKLWLAHSTEGLYVLTGSGNLTMGGLQDNDEQFEVLRVAADDEAALAEQGRRFNRLTGHAVALGHVQGTPYWKAWQQQLDQRRSLLEQQRALDESLALTAVADLAVEVLYEDLVALYETAKREVRISAPGGGTRPYVASYFKRAIDRSRGEGGPVPVVARMVKTPTEGFDHLAAAGRPDLMVETLIVDSSKPYHHLFSPTAVAQAQANLDAYYASRP